MKTIKTKITILLLFVAFGFSASAQSNTPVKNDTAAINIESIVSAMDRLNDAIKKLDKSKLDKISDKAIDVTRDAVASIDWNNIKRETAEGLHEAHSALQEIDWRDVGHQLTSAINDASNAINSIDWDKIGKDIQKASEKIDRVLKDKENK